MHDLILLGRIWDLMDSFRLFLHVQTARTHLLHHSTK